jgi:pimeloyl-ACP methyl ester carboxylesterase
MSLLATPPVDERRSVFRRVEGVNLHWVEYGREGVRPPVVLLHGLSDSHLTWEQIAPELARDRRVLALDLPGHGLSDRPDAGYELEWYARLVAGWMEALELPPVDIVGHSLGGGIALMLLRLCRPRIRRLVLAAPGGLGREIAFALRLAAAPGIVEHLGQPFMALGTRLALGRWRSKLPPGRIAELNAMSSRPGTARAFARTVRGLMGWRGQRHSFFRRAHELDELPPIAVLWGDRDAIIPIAHGKALQGAVEGARFVELAGCGHYLHHDDPQAFLQAVRDALDVASWAPMRLRAVTSAAAAASPRTARFARLWRSSPIANTNGGSGVGPGSAQGEAAPPSEA